VDLVWRILISKNKKGDKKMSKKKRDEKAEKRWFLIYYSGNKMLPMVVITLAYYLVVKIIFGGNFYVVALISAMVGGSWSFHFQKLYTEMIHKWNNWFETYDEYYNFLHSTDKYSQYFTIPFLIEIFIIWFFNP
jgi:hypothetical protein